MAKKSSRTRSRRDVNAIATTSHRVPALRPLRLSPLPSLADLTQYEDRRTYHPDGPHRPVFAFQRPAAAFVAKQKPQHRQASQTKGFLGFADPTRVLVCVRRKVRKQVIHAKGIAGGRVRRPKRNQQSKISCR